MAGRMKTLMGSGSSEEEEYRTERAEKHPDQCH